MLGNAYIGPASDWPNWRFDLAALAGPKAEVMRLLGEIEALVAEVQA